MSKEAIFVVYLIIIGFVFTVNALLSVISPFIVRFECHKSKTDDSRSLCQKYINLSFFNTSFMLYNSHILMCAFRDREFSEIWQKNGLLSDSFWILFSFYFLTPLLEAIDVSWFIVLFKRWKATRNLD